jgi:N-acetyl-anhydromuramyl-L-alanine amidase AmpD
VIRASAGRPATFLLLVAAACAASCGGNAPPRAKKPPPFVPGTEIVVCGERVDIGTPVVLWTDPIGFDAYSQRCRSIDQALPVQPDGEPSVLRYGARSRRAATPRELAEHVRLFVVHYDAVGSSERCFRALHDNRGLSVHFMLDLDGTVYQTLDLRERAFHAKDVNDESVGVEIANVGAMSTPKLLEAWYGRDDSGRVRNLFPPDKRLGEQRRADVVPRPARQELVGGTIQAARLVQWDFTEEQYDALARLIVGVNRALPRVRLEVPRDRKGAVPTRMLDPAVVARFEGVLGHYHLDEKKYDPGPAFDWERVLAEARRLDSAR